MIMTYWAIEINGKIAEWTIRASAEEALDAFFHERSDPAQGERDHPFRWWAGFQRQHGAKLVRLHATRAEDNT